MYNQSTTLNVEELVLLSINSMTYITKTYSVCLYVPTKDVEKFIELLEDICTGQYIKQVVTKKSLTPLFVNNLSRYRAREMLCEIKQRLALLEVPYVECEGRHKEETSESIQGTGHGTSKALGLHNCGFLDIEGPWNVSRDMIIEWSLKTDKEYTTMFPTLGDICEDKLQAALKEVCPPDIEIIRAPKGSVLDKKGKDICLVSSKGIWALQIKSSGLDAHLQIKRYPYTTCVWVEPDANESDVLALAKEILNATWGKQAPKVTSKPKPKPKQAVNHVVTSRPLPARPAPLTPVLHKQVHLYV